QTVHPLPGRGIAAVWGVDFDAVLDVAQGAAAPLLSDPDSERPVAPLVRVTDDREVVQLDLHFDLPAVHSRISVAGRGVAVGPADVGVEEHGQPTVPAGGAEQRCEAVVLVVLVPFPDPHGEAQAEGVLGFERPPTPVAPGHLPRGPLQLADLVQALLVSDVVVGELPGRRLHGGVLRSGYRFRLADDGFLPGRPGTGLSVHMDAGPPADGLAGADLAGRDLESVLGLLRRGRPARPEKP